MVIVKIAKRYHIYFAYFNINIVALKIIMFFTYINGNFVKIAKRYFMAFYTLLMKLYIDIFMYDYRDIEWLYVCHNDLFVTYA